MGDISHNILLAIRQARGIFEHIGALLSTADGLMGGEGWDTTASTCVAYSSASINLPKQWMPQEVFRFYKKDDSPNLLLFICILLDTRNEYESELRQALVTAGCFHYGQKEIVGKWEYWWARFHGYMPARTDDGAVHFADPKAQWPDKDYPFERVSTFAWPLAAISDTRDLSKKVIKTLLRVARGHD